ncbi:MAG: ASKHA domain-containing protein, partial [Kiritimatiellales bacterium]|nr:ASKHA domain-containing protein [Kiritimatiellales bacterium]
AKAHALRIDIGPDARVEAIPAISGYVGGDITSDILASNLWNRDGLTVLIDIGTNGEMVACLDGQMSACATAAGPAFEGAGLLHGTRAASRAIDTIAFDESLDFQITVIGDPNPMGLCGSAIIDFIACGFRCGLINMLGRYDVELLKSRSCHETVAGMHACVLVQAEDSATGETITVTEYDIAEILKAKAAIYSGLKTLLAELGKTVRDIDRVILAGGFAKHINLENAICIGLLPDIGTGKYEVIGNGSLAGASLAVLDRSAAQTYLEIIERPQIVTLNKTATFTNYFQEALAIPNLDEDDFPSIVKP